MIDLKFDFLLVVTMLIAVGIPNTLAAATAAIDQPEVHRALQSNQGKINLEFNASVDSYLEKEQFITSNEAIVKSDFIKRVSEIMVKGNSSLTHDSAREYLLRCAEASWTPQIRQAELNKTWQKHEASAKKLVE